jgi:hypothetical protein
MLDMHTAGSLKADSLAQDDGMSVVDVRQMTAAELRRLGVPSLVYLRQGTMDGQIAYAIHAADGSEVAIVEDVQVAIELAMEHGLSIATVH